MLTPRRARGDSITRQIEVDSNNIGDGVAWHGWLMEIRSVPLKSHLTIKVCCAGRQIWPKKELIVTVRGAHVTFAHPKKAQQFSPTCSKHAHSKYMGLVIVDAYYLPTSKKIEPALRAFERISRQAPRHYAAARH